MSFERKRRDPSKGRDLTQAKFLEQKDMIGTLIETPIEWPWRESAINVLLNQSFENVFIKPFLNAYEAFQKIIGAPLSILYEIGLRLKCLKESDTFYTLLAKPRDAKLKETGKLSAITKIEHHIKHHGDFHMMNIWQPCW